jgi:hypothetical protein
MPFPDAADWSGLGVNKLIEGSAFVNIKNVAAFPSIVAKPNDIPLLPGPSKFFPP